MGELRTMAHVESAQSLRAKPLRAVVQAQQATPRERCEALLLSVRRVADEANEYADEQGTTVLRMLANALDEVSATGAALVRETYRDR